jgi:putative oxidoreductase
MTLRDRYNTLASIGHNLCSALTWLPPLVARITVGLVFVWSGWGKLQNIPGMIERFRGWGIPAPEFQAPFASGSEFLFGGLILLGLFTRFSAIPLMIIMVVAMKTVAYDPAQAVDQGTFNYLFGLPEFLYIVILSWLAVFGAGGCSLDRVLFHKHDGKK